MSSVRSKIIRAYVGVSFVVTILLILPLSYFIENFFYDRLLNELKSQTRSIAVVLREHAQTGGRNENILSALRGISEAIGMRITLIDSSGIVLFESSLPDSLLGGIENHLVRPEIQSARVRGVGFDSRRSGTLGIRMVYGARAVDPAVFSSTSFPGLRYVRAGIVSNEIDAQVSEIRWMIAGAGFLAFVAVMIVSRVVSGRVARYILEIGEIVKDIKAGDLDRKLPVRTDDEIGRLAELINEMTDKLKEDITQLRRLERFRSEFLGNVSHELRTPIFSLKGFLETLSDGALEDPTVNRTFLEKAYHHASRLDILLTDLIEISRIESGDMKMSFRYFDVTSFLRHVRDDFIDEAGRKEQTIIVSPDSGEIKAFGDKDRLRQALESIVENAIKYSQSNAQILLKAVDGHDSVTIAISDNGPGIPPEHLPRIFERFYRVDKNRSREVGGTGLGLAIAKHIVEAHGSHIHVQSTVGGGSTFVFQLKK